MRALVLVLCFLTFSSFCFAATRQEIQIALDLVRFTNVANDLLDVSVGKARGQQLVYLEDGSKRSMTIDEIKASLIRTSQNTKGYTTTITQFLSIPENRTKAITGLQALGVSLTEIENDTQLLNNASNELNTRAANSKTVQDLNAVADYIEQTVPALPLVRRSRVAVGGR